GAPPGRGRAGRRRPGADPAGWPCRGREEGRSYRWMSARRVRIGQRADLVGAGAIYLLVHENENDSQ
ncbi:hypothetical protein, partial [Actinomyces sp. 565]|uniref:hypothetical protein n=1 Tax=Actinomyces sp. 565 TaxID=2057794 RepID=UPI00193A3925